MQHLQTLSDDLINNFTWNIKILQAIQATDWKTLPIDTPVIIAEYLTEIPRARKTGIMHFAGLANNKEKPFRVYAAGRSSLNTSDTYCYTLCLPLTTWKELFGEPA